MANFTACDKFLKQLKLGSGFSVELTRSMIPELCKTIPNKNGSFQEQYFHYACCHSARPIVHQNKYEVVHAVCAYLYHSENRTAGEDNFLQENCQRTNLSEEQGFRMELWLCILLVVLALLGFLFNALFVYTHSQCGKLQNTITFFVRGLSVSNIFTILQMIFFLIYFNNKEVLIDQTKTCLLTSFDIFSATASMLFVSAISFERAVAVLYPAEHALYFSHGNVCKAVKMMWSSAAVLFALSMFQLWIGDYLYKNVIFYLAVVLCLVVPSVFVVSSFFVISYHAARMYFNTKYETSEARASEIKAGCEVLLLTLPVCVGWGYFIVMNVHEEMKGKPIEGLINWSIILAPFLTSCLNVILYSVFVPAVRVNTWKLIKKQLRCFNKEVENSVRESIAEQDGVFILSDVDEDV